MAQTVITFCAAQNINIHCKGLQTLRIKETDRIAALDTELTKLDLASIEEIDSNNWILQTKKTTQSALVSIATYEDHRMAMSFAPLALITEKISIEEPNVVSKSYPMFWKDIESLGFRITSSS